jgi:hypothetical protein
MSSFKKRLERLEAAAQEATDDEGYYYVFDPNGTRPRDLTYRCYFKSIERYRARTEGKEPLRYTREELEHMYVDDVETAAGGGLEAELRDSVSWQGGEGRAILVSWVPDARKKVAMVEGGASLAEVYENEDEENEH